MNEKDLNSALEVWNKLTLINPIDVNVLNNIGVCWLGLNQPDHAKAVWQKALTLDPNSEIIKKNLEHLQNG
jgi:Flp pilus assembly protein TadD